MAKSWKKINKFTFCRVSLQRMREWKHNSRKYRRAAEKRMVANIKEIDGELDCDYYPFKYQVHRTTNDWNGPHDGYIRTFKKTRK